MSIIIQDIVKWSVILCVAALLLYLILPKYDFMGPNGFALYRCNTVTGEVLAWDISGKKWVTLSREMLGEFMFFKID